VVNEPDWKWDESPYKNKSVREIIDDYVLIRGDLSAAYARQQLVALMEHRIEEAEKRGSMLRCEAHIARAEDAEAKLAAIRAIFEGSSEQSGTGSG
jgi:hypothetical protein